MGHILEGEEMRIGSAGFYRLDALPVTQPAASKH